MFFFTYLLFVKLIFLNLFIAIILQGFDDTNQRSKNLFNDTHMNIFREKWSEFDVEGTSFIAIHQLPDLLTALGPPLGWDESYKEDEEERVMFISDLNLPIYNGFSHYNFMDILEALSLKMMINAHKEKKKSSSTNIIRDLKKLEKNKNQIVNVKHMNSLD